MYIILTKNVSRCNIMLLVLELVYFYSTYKDDGSVNKKCHLLTVFFFKDSVTVDLNI